MAIDYIINYLCQPKSALGEQTILEMLKADERAQAIIRIFREAGDQRPPDQMGFEMTHRTPEGEQTQLVVVQDLLNFAQPLQAYATHCRACPANALGKPFGCMGFIQYPISGKSETWLLNQLPTVRDALVYLLLKQGIDEFGYDGQSILPLRLNETYFEDKIPAMRRLGEFDITANQVFEMVFNVGDIQPNHAAVLLLFFNALERDLQAEEIMNITHTPEDAEQRYPFLHQDFPQDDDSISDFKRFLYALYVAWRLKVSVRLDV